MKEAAKSFEDLIVWRRAHQFVMAVYQLSQSFPRSETYGLSSQIRRAAVSIPANIAEGFRRYSDKDKLRFYNIARGSLEECRYYLILINDLKYSDITEAESLLVEVSKLLEAYCRKILNPES